VLHDYASCAAGPGFVVEHVVRGDTVGDVLRRAHHHAGDMLKAVRWVGGGG
jgi:hypothetical protein